MPTSQRKGSRKPRVALTIRLPHPLYETARQLAAQRNAPLAAVIVAAAEQTLHPSEGKQADEAAIRDAVQHCLHKIDRLERKLGTDLHILKEMVGLGVRTYLNHTAALPDTERAAATLSGRARFERFLDVLSNSLRDGASILTPSTPAPGTPATPATPGSSNPTPGNAEQSPLHSTITQESNHD